MEETLFGRVLLDFNLITMDQLNEAVKLQKGQPVPQPLGQILLDRGAIDEKTLQSILSVQKRQLELQHAHPAGAAEGLRTRLANASLPEMLRVAREVGASDFYLTSGHSPMVRLHGNLIDLPADAPDFPASKRMLMSVLTPEQQGRYDKDRYVELSLDLPETGRFRTSIFRHLRGIAGVFRTVAAGVTPFDELGLPGIVRNFTELSRGLVLVTGPAGSGKSTTLASLLDVINRTQRVHVVTIENPIELVHRSDKAFISQRQVPGHSRSFQTALRAALREDPDVLVVGELRDPETVSTAITAAETGHLIFGTLHTQNAHRTVMRILDQFPGSKRAYIRTLLAGVLRGVVSQQLVPNQDGRGRSLAAEVLVVNSAVANLIREDRTWQIPMVMQTSRKQGMRLMDDSLLELHRLKKISFEEALARASDRSKFVKP